MNITKETYQKVRLALKIALGFIATSIIVTLLILVLATSASVLMGILDEKSWRYSYSAQDVWVSVLLSLPWALYVANYQYLQMRKI